MNIRCKNSGRVVEVPLGSTLSEVYELCGLNMEYGPVSARVNNKVQGLNYRFYNSKDVEFLDLHSHSGMRVYSRTLFFILAKAVEDLYADGQLFIEAGVSRGYYCHLAIGRPVTEADVSDLRKRMQQIIDADMHIHRIQCPIEEAISLFRNRGMESKAQLLESQTNLYSYYYKLGDTVDYFYSCLLNSTGKIHLFDLELLDEGILLRIPSEDNPAVLYEICNEPNGGVTWARDVKPYAETVIAAIREGAPKSVILVGSPTWSQDIHEAAKDPLAGDNLMYTLHFYAWHLQIGSLCK